MVCIFMSSDENDSLLAKFNELSDWGQQLLYLHFLRKIKNSDVRRTRSCRQFSSKYCHRLFKKFKRCFNLGLQNWKPFFFILSPLVLEIPMINIEKTRPVYKSG